MTWRRLRAMLGRLLFLPPRADRELDDELRFHLDEEVRLQASRGLSDRAASAAARRAFGNVAAAKEATRAIWVSVRLEQLFQDLRIGCRILTRSPAVSVTAVVLIALVIGGNTTVFSIAHGILTKPAPAVRATGLTTVSWVSEAGAIETHAGYEVYAYFFEHSTSLRPLAAFDFERMTLVADGGSYGVRATLVSPNYFDTLGVRLAAGRAFAVEDAAPGSGLAVILGYHVWQNTFNGTNDVIGRQLTVSGLPATVVGVAEAGFRGAWLAELPDIWVSHPDRPDPRLRLQRGAAVAMVGQRAPAVSLSEAQAEFDMLWTRLQRADPTLDQHVRVRLVRYSATAGGNSLAATQGNRMLAIFSVITLLTVTIVCANVTNLLIARAVARQRETALRQALGASRARIVRTLLAEGLVLSVVAWTAACIFAWWIAQMVVRILQPFADTSVVMPDLRPDWTVVGYALLLALVCTVTVTLGPALQTWHHQLLRFLKAGEQSVAPGRSRISSALMVLQLAFSVLLMTSAGLAYRSLSFADSLDVGFDTSRIVLAEINTAGSADTPEANTRLLDAIQARLAQLPEVERLTYVQGGRINSWLDFPVRSESSRDLVMAVDNAVAADFFDTLGVPLIAGAPFKPVPPGGHARPTAIVTRHLAETLWPGQSPVGRVLLAGPLNQPRPVEIVGVVRDAYFSGRGGTTGPSYVFFPAADRPRPPGQTTFYIRASRAQAVSAPVMARAVRDVDARVALASLRSLDSQILSDVAPLWILATLLTLFAGASVLIAAIGQYALVAFDTRRRSREFGLRIALGASARQVAAGVVSESVRLTAIGLGVGFALSVAVATLLASVLYGITPTDAPTYGGVFLLLMGASLIASYLPARRAARTDPIRTLRTE